MSENTAHRKWLIAVVLLGLFLAIINTIIIKDKDFVGATDEAAFAAQADAILAGRGFYVDYIGSYFTKYDSVIRPEDQFSVGNGIVLAGVFAVIGRSVFSMNLPSVVYACLLLPPLLYLLSRKSGLKPQYAFFVCVIFLFNGLVTYFTTSAMVDIFLTLCMVSALLLVMRGTVPSFISAGIVLGAAYWFKPGGVLLIGCVLIIAWMLRSEKITVKAMVLRTIILLVIFVVVISPWLIRNYNEFGNPTYTTLRYGMWNWGYDPDWEEDGHNRGLVYWARGTEPPGLQELLEKRGFSAIVVEQFDRYLDVLTQQAVPVYNVITVLGFALLFRLKSVQAYLYAILLFTIQLVTLAVPVERYLFPVFPLAIIVGMLLMQHLFESESVRDWLEQSVLKKWSEYIGRRLKIRVTTPVVAIFMVALLFSLSGVSIVAKKMKDRGKIAPGHYVFMQSANWAIENLPSDSIIMCSSPWQHRFYTQMKTVKTPPDEPQYVNDVVDYYNVDYLLLFHHGSPTKPVDASSYAKKYLEKYPDKWQEVYRASDIYSYYKKVD